MAAVKAKDTAPELALRRYLFARGLRYRVHRRDLFGRPDLAFMTARVAVFVDGDFWHGNGSELRLHENKDFWVNKISGNVQRDMQVTRTLREQGWEVVRVYASEVDASVSQAGDRIIGLVRSRARSPRPR
jgi:DNA mismatch endonuclease (patch repair protein)